MTSYIKFLQLPLFQGLNKKSLTEFIEKIKFNFKTYYSSEIIAQQGTSCQKLIFILDGLVTKSSASPENLFNIEEIINSQNIIEITSLFGLCTNYNSTYIAKTDVNVLIIDKNYLLDYLLEDKIFKLNFLNILSSKVHQQYNAIWNKMDDNSLLNAFKKFILLHCEYLDSPITLRISMPDLAFLLRDTRLNVSKMLNQLNKNKIIELKRMTINIIQPQRLLNTPS